MDNAHYWNGMNVINTVAAYKSYRSRRKDVFPGGADIRKVLDPMLTRSRGVRSLPGKIWRTQIFFCYIVFVSVHPVGGNWESPILDVDQLLVDPDLVTMT